MIYTERLVIRPLKQGDYKDLNEMWADFADSPYAAYDRTRPAPAAAAEKIAAAMGESGDFFAVCLEQAGRPVIGSLERHGKGKQAEIGYIFKESAQGKGYAFEAVDALLDYLKAEGFAECVVGTALANKPSVALLEKLGFHLRRKEELAFHQDELGQPINFIGGYFCKRL